MGLAGGVAVYGVDVTLVLVQLISNFSLIHDGDPGSFSCAQCSHEFATPRRFKRKFEMSDGKLERGDVPVFFFRQSHRSRSVTGSRKVSGLARCFRNPLHW
jgi:hypothetical protein